MLNTRPFTKKAFLFLEFASFSCIFATHSRKILLSNPLTMNFKTSLSALILLLAGTLFAQTADNSLAFSSGIEELEKAFYQDSEEGIYYIDFDAVSVIVKSIVILDSQGMEKFKVEGADAPINEIFEIDPKALGLNPGRYILQVNSYTDSWQKAITVR